MIIKFINEQIFVVNLYEWLYESIELNGLK